MNDALQQAKIRQAEAKIATMKIARDAAYKALTAAQGRGAGPDRRQRLAQAYDRAEDRLEAAENEARELKRRAAGLTPTVGVHLHDLRAAYRAAAERAERPGATAADHAAWMTAQRAFYAAGGSDPIGGW